MPGHELLLRRRPRSLGQTPSLVEVLAGPARAVQLDRVTAASGQFVVARSVVRTCDGADGRLREVEEVSKDRPQLGK